MVERRSTYRLGIAAWLLVAAFSAAASAQTPEFLNLLDQIRALDAQTEDPSVDPLARAAARGRAIELRREAAGSAETGLLGPGCKVDLAVALLGRLTGDGEAGALLLGIPGSRECATAQDTAEEALKWLDDAQRAILTMLSHWDDRVTLTPEESNALAQWESDRYTRIPFLKARTHLLRAAATWACSRTPLHAGQAREAASEATRLLAEVRLEPGTAEASRLVSMAIAWLYLDQHSEAERWIASYKQLCQSGVKPDSLTETEAALVTLHCAVRESPEEAAVLLAVEEAVSRDAWAGDEGIRRATLTVGAARALAYRAAAMKDHATIARACNLLLRAGDQGASRLGPLLAMPALTWVDPAKLPADVVLAYAEHLATRRTGNEWHPSLPDPAGLLLGLLQRDDAHGVQPTAAQRLASQIRDSTVEDKPPDRREYELMMAALPAIVDCAERGADAGPGIVEPVLGRLLSLSRDENASPLPTDHVKQWPHKVMRPPVAECKALFVRAATVATRPGSTIERADTWRWLFADWLLREPRTDEAPLLLAYDLLAAIPPSAPEHEHVERYFTDGLEDYLKGRLAALSEARQAADAARLESRAREILSLAQRGVAWTREHAPDHLPFFELAAADANTELGSTAGLEAYQRLLPRIETGEVAGDAVRTRLGLGRAQLLAGQTEAGFATLRTLAASLDAPAPDPAAPPRRDEFWHAWALMLEVLQSQNADGSRSAAILAQTVRLRAIDPKLGESPWRERIEAVAAGVK